MSDAVHRPSSQPRQQLSLFDSTCIIVGIIIGSAIYESSPLIASNVVGPGLGWLEWLMGEPLSAGERNGAATLLVALAWILGGLIAWIGAACYAELATTYPRDGGNYVFLNRAFGREAGFGFAWIEFWIIRPGNLGAVAFVFARYAGQLAPGLEGPQAQALLAAGAIGGLSLINLIGIRAGKTTQNLLTVTKVGGLALVVLVALWLGPPASVAAAPVNLSGGDVALAFILIMFAYGGWSDMSYVAAEVRDPQRNITRALMLGTVAVAVLYVAVNLAFVWGLGLEGFLSSSAVAADVLARASSRIGTWIISVLICVSCLGAMNGMIFTGARIYYALGADHRLFSWLGRWNAGRGVPLRSLVLQAVVTIALVLAFGRHPNGFTRLVVFTAPFYWGFLFLVGLAVFALRQWDAHRPRPFRVPLYPLTPALFCLSSGWMTASAVSYVQHNLAWEGLWAVVVVAAGFAVERIDRRVEAVQEGITDSNIHA